jgi:hypothetical protein
MDVEIDMDMDENIDRDMEKNSVSWVLIEKSTDARSCPAPERDDTVRHSSIWYKTEVCQNADAGINFPDADG